MAYLVFVLAAAALATHSSALCPAGPWRPLSVHDSSVHGPMWIPASAPADTSGACVAAVSPPEHATTTLHAVREAGGDAAALVGRLASACADAHPNASLASVDGGARAVAALWSALDGWRGMDRMGLP